MSSPTYTGSFMFQSLSENLGIPIDQLNFVIAELSGILFGLFLRLSLPHSSNRPTLRLIYCLVLGLAFMYFLIGRSSWIVVFQVLLCYVVMKYFPQTYMQLVVFVLALGYLLGLYAHRYYKDMKPCYDETYPLMITTQKVTTLAFGLSDWNLLQKGKKMAPERERWAVRKLPGLLEYLAFTLSFQGVLAGPFCHYNLYRAFIEGNTKERLNEETKYPVFYEDDPKTMWKSVLSKVVAVLCWTYLTAWVKPIFPDELGADPTFIAENGVFTRVAYSYVSLFFHRCKYYTTWILADAVYNASGLGFVGSDENGKPQWTGMTNVNVLKIETATSLKVYLDNWNIMTTHWLRHVCYTRAPFQNTMLTFALSALWHGVHPGYYITFIGAAFFVLAGRKLRANLRPMFQHTESLRLLYDIITFVATQVSLPQIVQSFVVLDMSGILRFHKSFYFAFHLSALLLCVILPTKKRAALTADKPPSHSRPAPVVVDPDDNVSGSIQQQQQQQPHQNGVEKMQQHLQQLEFEKSNIRRHGNNGVAGGDAWANISRRGEPVALKA